MEGSQWPSAAQFAERESGIEEVEAITTADWHDEASRLIEELSRAIPKKAIYPHKALDELRWRVSVEV